MPLGCRFGEPQIDPSRLRFLSDPLTQAPPFANEALVRDIDILLRVDDHERAALGAKLRQHGSDRFVGPIAAAAARGHRDELGQLCGSAHVAVLGVALGQSLKDEPCHVAVVIGGQPRMDFLGMAIEGVMNGFDRRVLVMREIDRLLVRARLARHFPHAHQGVLNDW